MANERLTSSIDILEDGKIKAVYGGEVVYLQPMIYVDTLQSIERILLKSAPNSEEVIRVDTSIATIDGVSFAGTFAQLDTAIRTAVKSANSLFLGTAGGGGGGDATAANQVLEISELTNINTELDGQTTILNSIDSSLGLGATSTHTVVASSITVVTLKASNTSRKSLKITNNGNQKLYIKEGAGASLSSFIYVLFSDETLIIDDYNGIVTGIWNVANGDAQIEETV